MNQEIEIGKRWSGADWASEKRDIMIIGSGGIGSWTALSLSRIDHDIFIVDPDTIDSTNVQGGQLFRQKDIGKPKVQAITEICYEFGCTSQITPVQEYFSEEVGMLNICIGALDNMKARQEVFEAWVKLVTELETGDFPDKPESCLFIDGRLTLELYEVFAISGTDKEAIEKYRTEHLFSDEEANEVGCTVKQSTFGAMGIASFITGTLCNWLTNQKYGFDMREVPFYQRIHLPLMQQKHSNQAPETIERIVETERVVTQEVMVAGVQEAYPGELERLRNFHAVVGSLHGAALKPKTEVYIYSKPEIKEEVWEKL